MRNAYRVDGETVWIKLTRGLETAVELADLPLLQGIDCKWYANPLKVEGKFNAVASLFIAGIFDRRLSMHREILRLDDAEAEVFHRDENGLNNCRRNLEVVDHKSAMRARNPGRDWEAWDEERKREEFRIGVFKRLVAIGLELGEELGFCRTQMFKIRSGECRSPAADEYWRRVRVAFPWLFTVFETRPEWVVVAPFTKRKLWGKKKFKREVAA